MAAPLQKPWWDNLPAKGAFHVNVKYPDDFHFDSNKTLSIRIKNRVIDFYLLITENTYWYYVFRQGGQICIRCQHRKVWFMNAMEQFRTRILLLSETETCCLTKSPPVLVFKIPYTPWQKANYWGVLQRATQLSYYRADIFRELHFREEAISHAMICFHLSTTHTTNNVINLLSKEIKLCLNVLLCPTYPLAELPSTVHTPIQKWYTIVNLSYASISKKQTPLTIWLTSFQNKKVP